MSEGIEIEVMGHRGKITRLQPCPRAWSLKPEDAIFARVAFDHPVEGTMGMFVNIPAKDYTKGELVVAVVRAAEDFLKLDQKIEEERGKREARQQALRDLVDRVCEAVGLKPPGEV